MYIFFSILRAIFWENFSLNLSELYFSRLEPKGRRLLSTLFCLHFRSCLLCTPCLYLRCLWKLFWCQKLVAKVWVKIWNYVLFDFGEFLNIMYSYYKMELIRGERPNKILSWWLGNISLHVQAIELHFWKPQALSKLFLRHSVQKGCSR